MYINPNNKIGGTCVHTDLQSLDLIDLLSERNVLLRKITEKIWNDSSDLSISNSEWYIMARIYKQQPTISYVTKHADISRQATHKFIKRLEAKGLVEINNVEHNKKDKCIKLTVLGEQCFEKIAALKLTLEQKIADQIGNEQLEALKNLLKINWGL